MKRKIALLILPLFALLAILTACSQAQPTATAIRWDDDENHTFRITLAEFPSSEDDSADNAFHKDIALVGEGLNSSDEVKPTDVEGTYTLQIHTNGDVCTVTTSQTLYVKYAESEVTLNPSDNPDIFVENVAEVAPSLVDEDPNAEYVVLKSETTTDVTFTTAKQLPLNSNITVKGFYIGTNHQQVSNYTLTTTYNNDNHKATVESTIDGVTEQKEYKTPNTNFIDAAQLLMYTRSLDKSSSSFQDTPSTRVFYPMTGETLTVSFVLQYNAPMIITDANREPAQKGVSLNNVTVSLNGTPYMLQENIPEYAQKSDGEAIDIKPGSDSNADLRKYTTVRFRVRYFSYELEQYSEDQWEALKDYTDAV